MNSATRTALVIVDVQQDFCPGGSLAVTGGDQVARDITTLLDEDHGYKAVVATKDWHHAHDDNDGHFAADGNDPDFVDTWPAHCIAGTDGAEFHPDLKLADGTPVFLKGQGAPAFSGFEGARTLDGETQTLEQYLHINRIDAIDVVGLAYDFCDAATAIGGARRGFRVRVLRSLTADVAAPLPDGRTTVDAATTDLEAAGVTVIRGTLTKWNRAAREVTA